MIVLSKQTGCQDTSCEQGSHVSRKDRKPKSLIRQAHLPRCRILRGAVRRQLPEYPNRSREPQIELSRNLGQDRLSREVDDPLGSRPFLTAWMGNHLLLELPLYGLASVKEIIAILPYSLIYASYTVAFEYTSVCVYVVKRMARLVSYGERLGKVKLGLRAHERERKWASRVETIDLPAVDRIKWGPTRGRRAIGTANSWSSSTQTVWATVSRFNIY